jgi:hypothetical protein
MLVFVLMLSSVIIASFYPQIILVKPFRPYF